MARMTTTNEAAPNKGTPEMIQDELQRLRIDVKALQIDLMRLHGTTVVNSRIRRQEETSAVPAAALGRQTTDSIQSLALPAAILNLEINKATKHVATSFQTSFSATDMRQLALVAHNHMKPAMKDFIKTYSEVLQKFRITGTQTTMAMCKTLWGEDNPNITYGLTCTSGPLGGDAQIASLMCGEDLGALIFFIDPLSAHPHQVWSILQQCR